MIYYYINICFQKSCNMNFGKLKTGGMNEIIVYIC